MGSDSLDPAAKLVERTVTYTSEVNGKLFVIENVPARVDVETGEQFFRRKPLNASARSSEEKNGRCG